MLRWQQRKGSVWQWALGGLLLSSALIALLFVRSAPGVEAACSTSAFAPKIVTDFPNYYPSQTAQIDGCGFLGYASQSLPLRITRPDSSINSYTVVPNGSGNFTYYYALDGIQGTYLVQVFNASKTAVLASTTFTDGSVNLDQCSNGSPKFGDLHCDWQNGDINQSNSEYAEAEMIPFRLFVQGLDPSVSHTIHINYDFTKGGIKAYDFLTTWNNTQTGGDPCSGMAAAPTPCPPGALTTFAFPGDPFNPTNKGSLTVNGAIADAGVSRNLTIYNGSITGITVPVHSGPVTGNSDADMVVTFTANACVGTGCTSTVELLWGGHIAWSGYWGTGNGAASITGAPFHMRTQNLDGGGAMNQDRSTQLSAISTPTLTPTGTLTPSPTRTATGTPTNTPTSTNTFTPTPTSTATNTPTNTPTGTRSPTSTPTNTDTPTNTPTGTRSPTSTPTNTDTPTNTPTGTRSPTSTPTNTPTVTNTPVTPTVTAQVVTGTPTPRVTLTPTPVTPTVTPGGPIGGISLDPQPPGSSGGDAGLLAGAMAAALAGAFALGGGVWYARRRRVR